MRNLVASALVVLGVAASPAHALTLGDAPIPFRAERTVTVDGRLYQGPVFHEPGRDRHEQDLFGMHEVFLLDIKGALGFLVLPALRTYLEFPFPPLMAELDAPDLLRHPAGEERVSGIPTTKYRVDHRARDGSLARGFVWLSRAGVMMKFDVAVTRAHGGRPIPITMALSRLRTGPLDPVLFELPRGLVRLPADALGPLLGAQPAP
jgi:hypothetical protein